MYRRRLLDISSVLGQKSCFLFGPRLTGKTWLIRNECSDARVYNLLDSTTFRLLSHRPARIREELRPDTSLVVIDEIQKLPELLDEVHLMIEELGITFLLTGSSARKLRNGGVNLLGGRARSRHLHPFVRRELVADFELTRALSVGLIPSVYESQNPYEDLSAYVGEYLREEIAGEARSRNVPGFSRFLEVAAHSNGKIINHTNIANDCQVARTTVREYFQILEDTLLGTSLPAWRKGSKRKPLATEKFYFFDIGVVNLLTGNLKPLPGSPGYGELFEAYLHHELRAYIDYHAKRPHTLHYWRSTSGLEVDFVLDQRIAIETKVKETIATQDLKGLRAISEEGPFDHLFLVCRETTPRTIGSIDILPWQVFLDRLWSGEFEGD